VCGIQDDEEFWSMTPRIFYVLMQARAAKQKEQYHLVAWQTAHLLNVHAKPGKIITAEKLLGVQPSAKKQQQHLGQRIETNTNLAYDRESFNRIVEAARIKSSAK